jgi:hypothetical protein
MNRLASIRLQEFDLAQSRLTRPAADTWKMNLAWEGEACGHDQSNQGWLGARRCNRSVALDLVTVGGFWLGAAVHRFRILDAFHKTGLCH